MRGVITKDSLMRSNCVPVEAKFRHGSGQIPVEAQGSTVPIQGSRTSIIQNLFSILSNVSERLIFTIGSLQPFKFQGDALCNMPVPKWTNSRSAGIIQRMWLPIRSVQ